MSLWREIRKRAGDVVAPVLGFCVVGYFAYHSVEGERGLVAYVNLTQKLAEAKAQLADLAAERQALERRVSLLRPHNLDPDLLDERVRLMLNWGRPNEITILEPPESRR